MATDKNYPIDLPILVIEAQIFVAVNKFQFLPNKLIPSMEPSRSLTITEKASTRLELYPG